MTAYPLFNTTALFAGEKQPVHRYGIVQQRAAPNNIAPRGTVLGRIDDGSASVAAKSGGANTGNGATALAGSPLGPNAVPGVYKVRFTSATAFTVLDPTGGRLADGTAGAAYTDQVNFTATAGGTPFVAGDGFDITVLEINKFVSSIATAIDGSQIPRAILAADVDVGAADVECPLYFEGEFAWERLTVDPSWTDASLRVALQLNNVPIFIRTLGILG